MGIAFVIAACFFLIGAAFGVDFLDFFLVFWSCPVLVVPAAIALLVGIEMSKRYQLPRQRR